MDAGHPRTSYSLPGPHPSTHIPPGTPDIHPPRCATLTLHVQGSIDNTQYYTLSPTLLSSLSGRAHACDAVPTGITFLDVIPNILVGIDVVDHDEKSVVPTELMQSTVSDDEMSAIPAELGQTTFVGQEPVRFPLIVSPANPLKSDGRMNTKPIDIPIVFDDVTSSLHSYHQTIGRALLTTGLDTGGVRKQTYESKKTGGGVIMTKAPIAREIDGTMHASAGVFVFELRGNEPGFYDQEYDVPTYDTSTVDNHETKYLLVDPTHWKEVTTDMEERLKQEPTTISIVVTPIHPNKTKPLSRMVSVFLKVQIHFGRESLPNIYAAANLPYPRHEEIPEESDCDEEDESCTEEDEGEEIHVYSASETEAEEQREDDPSFDEPVVSRSTRTLKKGVIEEPFGVV